MVSQALKAALVLLVLAPAAPALAVTQVDHTQSDEAVGAVTTTDSSRAHADVQIRRIKNLIVTRRSDDDKDYETIERLQRVLHGLK